MSFLETRCGGGFPCTPREGAVPPSNPPEGGSAPWTRERGGSFPPYPPLTGRVRDRTGQAAFLPAARAGGAPQASRLLACRKGGKYHTAARRKYANARKRYTRPSVSERPKARRKVLCQAFFQESGGERSVTGAGPSGEILPGPSWTSWPPRRTPRPGASCAPSAAGQIQPFPLAARRSPRGCK